MRQLATIQKIQEVLPIEGADKIVKVRVQNWWMVTQIKQSPINTYWRLGSKAIMAS